MNLFRKLINILKRPSLARILWRHRVAATIEHTDALRNLPCATVVDIGANRGQFSTLARFLYPEARIYAFEPLPRPAKTFRSVFEGDRKVTLREAAVGDNKGMAVMHVSARDDSSSVLPISTEQTRIFPGTAEVTTASVEMVLLADALKASDLEGPALLKIDVQGYELNVLQGCGPLLPLFSYIFCECSFREMYEGQALAHTVIEYLQIKEFQLTGVYNVSYTRSGEAVQADFLFCNSANTCQAEKEQ